MATPLLTYNCKLKDQKKRIIKKQEIPTGHNPKNYILTRVYASSLDGKKIPISIIKEKIPLKMLRLYYMDMDHMEFQYRQVFLLQDFP